VLADRPVVVPLRHRITEVPDALHHLDGPRSIADKIPEAVALRHTLRFDVREHGLERSQVPVDVAIQRDPPHAPVIPLG